MGASEKRNQGERPYIHDFSEALDFLRALALHYKENVRGFSLRQRALKAQGCSPALVSLLLSGQRRLRRDHLAALSRIFSLQSFEASQIDRWIASDSGNEVLPAVAGEKRRGSREPKNHLFRDWVNVYVKDCCELRSFVNDPRKVFSLLGGMVNEKRIARAMRFLLQEGFWRINSSGKIVPNEALVVSTQDIPNKKIRDVHGQALKIAARGLRELPSSRRVNSTVVVAVNKESLGKLRALVKNFQQDLFDFVEDHPGGNEQLCQVVVHLTPLGGECHD